ncbi:hypothetical protein ACFL0X_02685 [Nanoarchaeota archaeon]
MKQTTGKDLMELGKKFGFPKKLKKNTEQIMKEIDEELWPERNILPQKYL